MAKRIQSERGKATIKDVAAKAGVAWMTVSRVLSAPDVVTPATRARVEAAIVDCGYVPNSLARGLRASRSRIVVVIVPSISNPVFSEVIRGVSDLLNPHGFEILFGSTDYDLVVEERRVRTFLQWGPEAFIIAGSTHSDGTIELLQTRSVTVVEIMETTPTPIDLNVGLCHTRVGRDMGIYLCDRGYSRMAFVSTRIQGDARALRRRDGFRAALEQKGVRRPLEHDLDETLSYGVGVHYVRQLLKQKRRPDALYFSSDVLAVGALLECQRQGFEVPKGIAVAGFNGLDISEHVNPPLTTTLTPRYEIGHTAARMVLDRHAGTNDLPAQIDVGSELLRRQSA